MTNQKVSSAWTMKVLLVDPRRDPSEDPVKGLTMSTRARPHSDPGRYDLHNNAVTSPQASTSQKGWSHIVITSPILSRDPLRQESQVTGNISYPKRALTLNRSINPTKRTLQRWNFSHSLCSPRNPAIIFSKVFRVCECEMRSGRRRTLILGIFLPLSEEIRAVSEAHSTLLRWSLKLMAALLRSFPSFIKSTLSGHDYTRSPHPSRCPRVACMLQRYRSDKGVACKMVASGCHARFAFRVEGKTSKWEKKQSRGRRKFSGIFTKNSSFAFHNSTQANRDSPRKIYNKGELHGEGEAEEPTN